MGTGCIWLYIVNITQRYAGVFEWLRQNHVMCIRFEDLIDNRDATLDAMPDEVESLGYRIPIMTGKKSSGPSLVQNSSSF
jgi:hypothetical protein